MANRHKSSRSGVRSDTVVYGNPKVVAAAKERKDGGRAEYKHGGKVAGKRMDKRARGGRAGSDKNPFSSAGSGLRGG